MTTALGFYLIVTAVNCGTWLLASDEGTMRSLFHAIISQVFISLIFVGSMLMTSMA